MSALESRRRDLIILISRASEELLRIERMLTKAAVRTVIITKAADDGEDPGLLADALAGKAKVIRAWCAENDISCPATGRVNRDIRLDWARAMAKEASAS